MLGIDLFGSPVLCPLGSCSQSLERHRSRPRRRSAAGPPPARRRSGRRRSASAAGAPRAPGSMVLLPAAWCRRSCCSSSRACTPRAPPSMRRVQLTDGQRMGSAMKCLKLSVRVSSAFHRLGNDARLVSWGCMKWFPPLSY